MGFGEGQSYTYDSGTDSYILSSYPCNINNLNVNIPSSNNNKPVTSIGASVFAFCTTLQNITLPSTITSIQSDAFLDCTGLISLKFLGNQPTFGSNVFGSAVGNAKIYRIPGKNWNTSYIQGVPIELFYPENYIIKNRIISGGTGKLITKKI